MKVINEGKATGYIYNLKLTTHNCLNSCPDSLKEEELLLKSIKRVEEKLLILKEKTTNNVKDIISIYLAFLNDDYVNNEILTLIKEKKLCAGKAYEEVINKYVLTLKKSSDEYLKERANDFLDIKDKVIKEMYQKEEGLIFKKPTILMVDSLSTSLSLSLPKEVKAVISKTGGALSHAAIVMKEKNIPYIISDKNIKNGKIFYLNTKEKKLVELKSLKENLTEDEQLPLEEIKDLKTKIYLNLSTIDNLDSYRNDYYCGVGLVRTENLWIDEFTYPEVKEQTNKYKKILSAFYPKEVKIRLFDIKKDKAFYIFINEELLEFKFSGPFLTLYKDQLKALMLANESYGNLSITIPMLNDINEYNKVKEYLKTIKKELKLIKELPKLGMMLETEVALNKFEEFKTVDYFSVGTNDLVKELFKIDRDKTFKREKIIEKMIKKIKPFAEFIEKEGISTVYCGDLVSTKFGLTKLLEQGDKNISIANGFLIEAVKIIKEIKK